MSNPEYRPLDPAAAPPPLTPSDSPADASGYASVMPSGQGPAPYDIQAPLDDLSGMAASAIALTGGSEGAPTGAGLPDRMGPRQSQAAAMMDSPQGFAAGGGTSGYDITAGFSGAGGDGWPNDVQPGILETPIQGMGSNQANTGTD